MTRDMRVLRMHKKADKIDLEHAEVAEQRSYILQMLTEALGDEVLAQEALDRFRRRVSRLAAAYVGKARQ